MEVLTSYVSQPGVPLVRVRSRCEGNATVVDLEQTRFLLGSERSPDQLWSIPVCFTDGACIVLRERTQSVRRSGCRDSVFPNDEGRGYYVTTLEPAAQTALAGGRDLSPSERMAFVRDQWLLVRAGSHSLDDYLQTATAFGNDRHVADQVLTTLGYITRHRVDGAREERLQTLLRQLATPILSDLGWSVRPGDTREDLELRNKVIELLGDHAADTATRRRGRELTNRWLRDANALSPEVVSDVARIAAIGGDAKLYAAFLKGYRTNSDPNQKLRFLSLLGAFRDPQLLRRTLQLTLTDEIRGQDLASVLAGVIGNPAGRDIAWRFLNENWSAIERKLPPGHTGRVLTALSANACDPVWQERIRQFTAEHPMPQSERAVRVAIERIGNCVELRALQGG
ncbi:MAG TPA: ERAP1-like C-terminal domain-containing protein [Thermoanaerobaculia bacterium]|nr:ERAP1-like C-terminal domain-containing protein [Thermoanaerobaculia bacterium]